LAPPPAPPHLRLPLPALTALTSHKAVHPTRSMDFAALKAKAVCPSSLAAHSLVRSRRSPSSANRKQPPRARGPASPPPNPPSATSPSVLRSARPASSPPSTSSARDRTSSSTPTRSASYRLRRDGSPSTARPTRAVHHHQRPTRPRLRPRPRPARRRRLRGSRRRSRHRLLEPPNLLPSHAHLRPARPSSRHLRSHPRRAAPSRRRPTATPSRTTSPRRRLLLPRSRHARLHRHRPSPDPPS